MQISVEGVGELSAGSFSGAAKDGRKKRSVLTGDVNRIASGEVIVFGT